MKSFTFNVSASFHQLIIHIHIGGGQAKLLETRRPAEFIANSNQTPEPANQGLWVHT